MEIKNGFTLIGLPACQGVAQRAKRSIKFTLIELMVVISIIAILASLLLPSLKKAKEAAYSISCKGNLKSIGIALPLYSDDWGNWMPTSNTTATTGNQYWSDFLLPYLGDNKTIFYACPSAQNRKYNYSTLSYGYNRYLSGGISSGGYRRIFSVRQPSLAFLAADSERPASASGPVDRNANWTWDNDQLATYINFSYAPHYRHGSFGGISSSPADMARVTGLANFSFCDGHVDSMRAVDSFKFPTDSDYWDYKGSNPMSTAIKWGQSFSYNKDGAQAPLPTPP
jgi:prepilin-type N-terminal cleavage/methylation domain-containing protein/prepilin-type processing-associated H-X9-DG protein